MDFFISIVFFLSIVAFCVFLVWLVIALIARKRKKTSVVGLIISFVLVIITFLILPVDSSSNGKVPDGYIEGSFEELTYCIPNDWEVRGENSGDVVHFVIYSQDEEIFNSKGLAIYAEDVISTMNDLAVYQMMVFGDEPIAETYEEKLELLARIELQLSTIEEEEICTIDGVKAIRTKSSLESGFEVTDYFFTTDNYYYHFEFTDDGDTITSEFSDTIDQIIGTMQIAN